MGDRRSLRALALVLPLTLAGAAPGAPPRADITGLVFVDTNANGVRDGGEPGLPGVAVSDQADVVTTGRDGTFRIPNSSRGVVFVSVPDTYRPVGSFWQAVDSSGSGKPMVFALAPAIPPVDFTFIHASDTHISPASAGRTEKLRAIVDSVKPAFVLVTGDLVRDALRVSEAEATGYYNLFKEQRDKFTVPVWTVPGNHEIFGIERHLSLVSPKHPLYARGMYHRYFGPDYYSFTFGGIHFVGLNSVDYEDLAYYGHVDSIQVAWLEKDLANVPATTPVVTFNHIPFFTAVETINGLMDTPPAPSVITIRGHAQFRHTVANAGDVIALIRGGHPYDLALGGHMHVREQLRYAGVPIRFFQTGAVVGPSEGSGITFPSGVVVYHVRGGRIDDGTFVEIK